MNVEVFDHLKNEEEPTDVNANDDLVKTIIHMKTTAGIEVAQIQEKLLNSLSGEQLEEINKDLEERLQGKDVLFLYYKKLKYLQIVLRTKTCL